MPDITMCCNYGCPLKEKCYRYRAVPDPYWQSFAMYKPEERVGSPVKVMDAQCFWQIDWVNDKILPLDVVDNRYERDEKWQGLK